MLLEFVTVEKERLLIQIEIAHGFVDLSKIALTLYSSKSTIKLNPKA